MSDTPAGYPTEAQPNPLMSKINKMVADGHNESTPEQAIEKLLMESPELYDEYESKLRKEQEAFDNQHYRNR